ncbi:hypothetical protein Tsubulata_038802 [Turnera subulata]|uniref:14-3-3 domain-containing protein n=1 Tax=Turnera subulata TaxID=218843 RepID=A0A9Q0J9K7_9ROSI|nr:hypothetical protein Tsubulata_038802 [Turnera subulata]
MKNIIFPARMAPRSREEEEENVIFTSASTNVGAELSPEEGDLFSAVDARRASLRLISSLEQKEITEPGRRGVTMIRDYRARVEAELSSACDRILKLLESRLIPSATAAESKVLYLKMKGDHHRYLAELKREKALGGSTMKEEYLSAVEAYQRARDIAREELAATHPVRLELALNYSVFCRDILKDSFAGYHQARLAVEGADAELGKLEVEEESNKDSTTLWILQLLRDNLTLWGEPAETQVPGESMDHTSVAWGWEDYSIDANESSKADDEGAGGTPDLVPEFFKIKTLQLGGSSGGNGTGGSNSNDTSK